jgi:hypothetical protein
MPDIVISYRRADTAATAGRIRDCLVREYGEASVYMDVESIPSGVEDYREHIQKAIIGTKVLIAIIGPKWCGSKSGRGARIQNSTDTVRAELEAALQRRIPIIPVLVDNAVMPHERDIPDSLSSLSFAQACKVAGDHDFHAHMQNLIRDIDNILHKQTAFGFGYRKVGKWLRRSPLRIAVPVCIVAATVGGYYSFFRNGSFAENGVYAPPSPRSHWIVGQSVVFLEAAGPVRQFYFVKPSPDLMALGARPGTLLFEGRKEGDKYQGKAYVFAGRCGKLAYDAQGDVLNDLRTVDLRGNAPQIDQAVCRQVGWEEQRLVFDLKEVK